ncbi:helix-turn-helix domain-containing protein [Bdellovibrio sp. SKB1291214]|uniref:helix-turn-helix domain-containing protein n=1 Tax=Bdellovibrio sp. SKB1291214 TaxID=1732569 RepID=UPI0015954CED|nr:helix-turn-helix transcriptional regulator [Bdellovibrio sp. SKB1291214]UYL08171.1 helix-turn-helix domain-containing protein [Bdellovibrio sp. SKB1291214]
MSLSDYIKKKRLNALLTQQEAAKLLGYKKSQFLSNLELGNRKPPLEVLKKMCEVYKIPPEEMREEYIRSTSKEAEETAEKKWDESEKKSAKDDGKSNGE